MIRRPPRSTRTDTLFPYTTLFRSLDESVGCVVVTGAGRAFCAGGDTRSGAARDTGPKSQEQRVDAMVHHAETVRLLHLMPKPTLAIVNGAAAGAGLALALACDMRIAASDAMMTTAYVRLRSDELRGGDECVSTCMSRWWPYHSKKKKKT